MMSAGNSTVNSQPAQQQNPWAVNPWAGQYPGQYPGQYQAQETGPSIVTPNFQFPTYQFGGNNNGLKTNATIKMNSADGKEYLKTSAITGAVNDTMGAILNIVSASLQSELATASLEAQTTLGLEYYRTKVEMGDMQKEVTLKQLENQGKALDTQESLARIDSETAIALKDIESKGASELERVKQKGMSDRSKVAASAGMFSSQRTDPFARGSWFYG